MKLQGEHLNYNLPEEGDETSELPSKGTNEYNRKADSKTEKTESFNCTLGTMTK